ncbi:protein arginine N-methyltransferase [Roridomyces roridus]|uniref:type I protein arginine methyltransferase n=1 Tax=Roridomyces roridus TaxID=1738132 RepID=A0AAD7CC22_9AGAR|nr:protein arginine N-methyltransferase [Roridomyces roridus]
MSIVLPPPTSIPSDDDRSDREESGSESSTDDEPEPWDDWISDSAARQPCRSLFESNKELPSVDEALEYDRKTHGFDLDGFCGSIGLDTHGRIRLINFIRKTHPTPSEVAALTGKENIFTSDEYLKPAIEDDPLLQVQPDDWSDSDAEDTTTTDPAKRIRLLEKRLAAAQQDLVDYRTMISTTLPRIITAVNEDPGPSTTGPAARDDDSHYFQSYEENDIHAVMIQDKVRTSTYAHFILTNPALFRDATVLDVGCGTGILSLFAARAGAKRVIAVDASDIALKARKIVAANNLSHVITVLQGKVEDIVLPDEIKEVDVIISEWMGYALLYESMLDSVLRARERFLRPGGVMAPSQCRMRLALCDAREVIKERVGFWDDVYGYDMSAMKEGLYDDAIVDVVGPDTLLSEPYTVKDLHLGVITPRQLSFISPFTLTSTASRRTKLTSFVLYFDTFFAPDGLPLPDSEQVKVVREGDAVVAEVWHVGGRPAVIRRVSQGPGLAGEKEKEKEEKVTSFSTGPESIPTHWKQTLFLLRDPVDIVEGTIVSGHFHCTKSSINSRELDVEVHYSVKQEGGEVGLTVVQMYKVR